MALMSWPRCGFILLAVVVALAGCSPLRLLDATVITADHEATRDLAYGPLPEQRLDVYRPRAAAGAPVVVFFHGGNWQSGSRHEYRFVGAALAARGLVAVIPDYRLYPAVEFPAFVQDGAGAVRWVRDHIAERGGDPGRIYLVGHSAGAHIAALLTLDETYLGTLGLDARSIRGTIGLAGPYDFLPFSAALRPVFGPSGGWSRTQPINFVDGRESPILLLQGAADDTVNPANSTRLASRIREAGGVVEEIVYPGIGHSRILLALSPLFRSPPVVDDIIRFIHRN